MSRVMEAGLLKQIPLFAELADAEREELAGLLEQRSYDAQQPIIWIGDPGTDFYIVESGKVELVCPDETGKEMILGLLGPGQFFGEISLLDGGPRTATARALTATTLLCLGRDSFLKFLQTRPSSATHMLMVLGRRQREMVQRLRTVRNANDLIAAAEEASTAWQRIADKIAAMSASQMFVLVHLVWFGAWMMLNRLVPKLAFDPPPFGLLTMIVSLEAIFLSIFVLVSANRQSEKDRIRSDLDYQVNLKAHHEVMHLHQKVDRLEARMSAHEGSKA